MLNALDEHVEWQDPRPADIPWGGERHGRDAVAQFFISTNQHLEVEQFRPEQFVARDDQVIVFGHERMRTRDGGRVYGTDWVHAFTLRSGKIVGFRQYTDTATIVEALRQPARTAVSRP